MTDHNDFYRGHRKAKLASVAWGIRIQSTFALVRVIRGDLSWDINCPIPPAYCMIGLLACSEASRFALSGTGLSGFRQYTVPKADEFFFLKNQRYPEGRS